MSTEFNKSIPFIKFRAEEKVQRSEFDFLHMEKKEITNDWTNEKTQHTKLMSRWYYVHIRTNTWDILSFNSTSLMFIILLSSFALCYNMKIIFNLFILLYLFPHFNCHSSFSKAIGNTFFPFFMVFLSYFFLSFFNEMKKKRRHNKQWNGIDFIDREWLRWSLNRILSIKWQKASGKDVVKPILKLFFCVCVYFKVNRDETPEPTHYQKIVILDNAWKKVEEGVERWKMVDASRKPF